MSIDWRSLAVCRDEDPELFHPVGDSGPALLQERAAKAVCLTCPVIADCLAHALLHGEAGIWGATTEDERRALRQQARQPARTG